MSNLFLSISWTQFLARFNRWLLTELASIIILILILTVLLKTSSFFVKKLKNFLMKKAVYKEDQVDREAEKRLNTLMGVLLKILQVTIWSIFIMIFLAKLNINIMPILSAAGIVGVAVGFGSQELVRDFISGFFILLEDGIRTGDVVALNGTTGTVEKMELRTITLRDSSGVVHIFQNGKINSISNMTKGWSAIVFNIGVAYKEDLDNVMQLMQQVGDELFSDEAYKPKMLGSIEVSGLNNFGDSALEIRGRIRTRPGEQWGVGREYRKRLKEAFDKHNIEIPFPHQTIYWGDDIKPLELILDKEAKKA